MDKEEYKIFLKENITLKKWMNVIWSVLKQHYGPENAEYICEMIRTGDTAAIDMEVYSKWDF